jgi:hypothetical protein
LSENDWFNYFFKWSIWDENEHDDWKIKKLLFKKKISYANNHIKSNNSDECYSWWKDKNVLTIRFERFW